MLTQQEVAHLLSHLIDVHWLIGCLMYGSGLRLMEGVRLRVKDIDFSHRAVFVRDGNTLFQRKEEALILAAILNAGIISMRVVYRRQ